MPPNSTYHATFPITVLFGSVQSPYHLLLNGEPIEAAQYQTLCQYIRTDTEHAAQLILLDQVHGIAGHCITSETLTSYIPQTLQGDYTITNVPQVALGILTADCIPLLLHDPTIPIIAAVHVGWQGAIAGIVRTVIVELQNRYACSPHNLYAWIGPSARGCCYAINEPIVSMIRNNIADVTKILEKRNTQYYADFSQYVLHELQSYKVSLSAITRMPICTICSPQYFSHRRQPHPRMRNISYIMLT